MKCFLLLFSFLFFFRFASFRVLDWVELIICNFNFISHFYWDFLSIYIFYLIFQLLIFISSPLSSQYCFLGIYIFLSWLFDRWYYLCHPFRSSIFLCLRSILLIIFLLNFVVVLIRWFIFTFFFCIFLQSKVYSSG